MGKIEIKDKPQGCFAWAPTNSSKVMCNSIPCCGFCISPQMEKAIEDEGNFKTKNNLKFNISSNHISN